MGIFQQLGKSKGGYIFFSHSHDDIVVVRRIRNSLEENGFEPLCFFLKCLSDDSEIEDLIKREIDAREWFLFGDSENARNSRWVTMEREYIKRTDSKKIITVDLEDHRAVSAIIEHITHNLRVFISYSYKDEAIARRIKNLLEEKEYLVFFGQDDLLIGEPFEQKIMNALVEASREGCVLALISANSAESAWVKKEIEFALRNNGNIIPVILGDVKLPVRFNYLLDGIQHYRISENPTDEEIAYMIEEMSKSILKKRNQGKICVHV